MAVVDQLTTEIRQTDALLTAAQLVEPEPVKITTTTAEGREVLELREKSSIAGFVQNMASNRSEGPEHEFRAAVLGDSWALNHLPVDMLLPMNEYRRMHLPVEEWAVTPVAAAALTEGNQGSIAGRVFARSIPGFLNIPMPTVGPGLAGYPKLSGGTTFSVQAASGEQLPVAGTFAGEELNPIRTTGGYEFRVEDVAKLVGIEEALRVDLREGVNNLLNNQSVNGNGTAPNVDGIIHAVGATPSANPGSADTFSQISDRLLGVVDGLFSTSPRDLQMVMKGDIYARLASTYATNDDSVSAFDHVAARVGGIMVNDIIPAKANNNDIGHVIVHRSGYPQRSALMPIWRNLEMTVDPYTGASKGEIKLTVVVLF